MYKHSLCSLITCGILLAASGTAFAVGNPVTGKALAFDCSGCHAVRGYRYMYPANHVPKLGGQHAAYIVNALKEYKSGARPNPTMHANASTLTTSDMEDIAAYFASQKGQSDK